MRLKLLTLAGLCAMLVVMWNPPVHADACDDCIQYCFDYCGCGTPSNPTCDLNTNSCVNGCSDSCYASQYCTGGGGGGGECSSSGALCGMGAHCCSGQCVNYGPGLPTYCL